VSVLHNSVKINFQRRNAKKRLVEKIDLKDDLVGGASSCVQTTVALSRGVIKNWFVTSLIGY
jgi:hypothetical protein